MSGTVTLIDEMALAGTKGKITISTIAQPYGPKSESVTSIGISLKANADEPEWKVHIPKSNIEQVIEALKKAKEQL
jgi:hypothetical protein